MTAPATAPLEGDRSDRDDLCPWCGRAACECHLEMDREASWWREVSA